jgi:hypothetical protein
LQAIDPRYILVIPLESDHLTLRVGMVALHRFAPDEVVSTPRRSGLAGRAPRCLDASMRPQS